MNNSVMTFVCVGYTVEKISNKSRVFRSVLRNAYTSPGMTDVDVTGSPSTDGAGMITDRHASTESLKYAGTSNAARSANVISCGKEEGLPPSLLAAHNRIERG